MNCKRILCVLFSMALLFSLFGCNVDQGGESSTCQTEAGASVTGGENEESPSDEEHENYNTIKIGVLEPQNGPYAENGRLMLLGLRYANSKKPSVKVKGETCRIELVIESSFNSLSSLKKGAQKLIKSGVCAVIGPSGGAYQLSAVPLLENAGVPMLTVTGSPLKLAEDYSNVFSLSKSDEYMGKRMANYIYKTLGLSDVYVLCMLGDDSSEEAAFFLSQQLESLGGRALLKTFTSDTYDFSPYTVEAASKDALVVLAPLSFSRQIIFSASSSGVGKIIASNQWSSEKAARDAAEANPELYLCTNLKYNETSQRAKAFMNWMGSDADLSELSGGFIESGIAYGAVDAYNALLAAIKAANSADPAKIAAKLKTLELKGITGTVSFDSLGRRSSGAAFYIADKASVSWKKLG